MTKLTELSQKLLGLDAVSEVAFLVGAKVVQPGVYLSFSPPIGQRRFSKKKKKKEKNDRSRRDPDHRR